MGEVGVVVAAVTGGGWEGVRSKAGGLDLQLHIIADG